MANFLERSQKLAKAAHSLSAEALGRDEFETIMREKKCLAEAFGVPVEIFSADAGGGSPRARAARRSRGGQQFILSRERLMSAAQ